MVVTRISGGLGNQMFQYAIARNLAKKNKSKLKLDITVLLDRTPRSNFTFRNYDLDIFNIKEEFTIPSKFAKTTKISIIPSVMSYISSKIRFKTYIENKKFEFDKSLLSATGDIYLAGYWQSEKYFKDIEPIIRNDFTFKMKLDKKSQKLLKKINSFNSVCLNVRRTDFISNPKIAQTLGTIDVEYYQEAAKILTRKVKKPHFFIFSDDVVWCKENIKLNYPCEFIDHTYAGHKFSQYLQLMVNCKYFIIPNSTFAWWAAWLSPFKNKIVIAPKKWFNDTNMNSRNIIPNSWIRI